MSDYKAAVRGALKLKGTGAGVDKKRKKKKPKPNDDGEDDNSAAAKSEVDAGSRPGEALTTATDDDPKDEDSTTAAKTESAATENPPAELSAAEAAEARRHLGMTASERRFDEQRRKRLAERMKREGAGAAKTHKERVEEFNRQLARQSEHHDMPKIGPG